MVGCENAEFKMCRFRVRMNERLGCLIADGVYM